MRLVHSGVRGLCNCLRAEENTASGGLNSDIDARDAAGNDDGRSFIRGVT